MHLKNVKENRRVNNLYIARALCSFDCNHKKILLFDFSQACADDLFLRKYNMEGEDRRREGPFLAFMSVGSAVVRPLWLAKRKML